MSKRSSAVVELLSFEDDIPLDTLKTFVENVLEVLGLANWSVSIAFFDADHMALLNYQYRGVKQSTDVLAFPQDVELSELLLGDIALDRSLIRQHAESVGITEEEELRRCLVHGLLHLAGMTHAEGWDSEMIMVQEWIMTRKMDCIYS